VSWSDPTGEWRPTPISALEHVVHASLLAAAPYGYRMLRPDGGEVPRLFGVPVPGGSLDNAAFYTGMGVDGTPLPPVVVSIEVKNVRGWIYPSTQELYQLLEKSARLQIAHPDQRFMPVFVCRRMHPSLGWMAKHLGFYAIATWRQYIRPVVAADETGLRLFNEVDSELGYNLELHEGVVQPMVRHFTTLLPKNMLTSVDRWSAVAQRPAVPGLLSHLRDDRISRNDRHMTKNELAEAAEEATGDEATWAPRAAEHQDDYEDWRDED